MLGKGKSRERCLKGGKKKLRGGWPEAGKARRGKEPAISDFFFKGKKKRPPSPLCRCADSWGNDGGVAQRRGVACGRYMPFQADKYLAPGVDGRLREPPRSTPHPPFTLADPREFSLNHRYHAPLQRFPRCLAPTEPTMPSAPEACACPPCPLWSQWRGPMVPSPSSAGVPNSPKLGQPKFFFFS